MRKTHEKLLLVQGDLERDGRGAPVDTSLLVQELRKKYQQIQKPINVDFRKLVNWVRLGDQLTHQLHPYPGKLLPHIAHLFLRASNFTSEASVVIDPFCGSGTVALEASIAGFTPYVSDANPFALLITKVKTTAYVPDELRATTQSIISCARRYRTAPEIPVVNHHLWYSESRKKELEILLRAVEGVSNLDQRHFFRLCFSVIARRLSFSDPTISVPVRLKTKTSFDSTVNKKIKARLAWIKSANVCAEFAEVCFSNIERVEKANEAFQGRRVAVEVGNDARKLFMPESQGKIPLRSGSVPLVITSPPYGSAQKYIRAMSLSLNWLGLAAPNDLSILERASIGREHVSVTQDRVPEKELPDDFERLLRRVSKTNVMRERITRSYLFELKCALAEIARITSKGGKVVLVIGNNQVCGESLRNDKFILHVMKEFGFHLDMHLIDRIKSRGLMIKRNKTASVIAGESVMVFSR